MYQKLMKIVTLDTDKLDGIDIKSKILWNCQELSRTDKIIKKKMKNKR